MCISSKSQKYPASATSLILRIYNLGNAVFQHVLERFIYLELSTHKPKIEWVLFFHLKCKCITSEDINAEYLENIDWSINEWLLTSVGCELPSFVSLIQWVWHQFLFVKQICSRTFTLMLKVKAGYLGSKEDTFWYIYSLLDD